MYGLLGTYFQGIPALSSMKRLDVLAGGIPNTNATSAPPTGTVQIQQFVIASTYSSNPYGTMFGSQTLSDGWNAIEKVIASKASVATGAFYVTVTSEHKTTCTTPLARSLSITISQTFTGTNGWSFEGSANYYFNTANSICGTPATTLASIVTTDKNIITSQPDMELRDSANNVIPDSSIVTDNDIETVAAAIANNASLNVTFFGPSYPEGTLGYHWAYSNVQAKSIPIFPTDTTLIKKKKEIMNTIYMYKIQKINHIEKKNFITAVATSSIFQAGATVATACSKVQ